MQASLQGPSWSVSNKFPAATTCGVETIGFVRGKDRDSHHERSLEKILQDKDATAASKPWEDRPQLMGPVRTTTDLPILFCRVGIKSRTKERDNTTEDVSRG